MRVRGFVDDWNEGASVIMRGLLLTMILMGSCGSVLATSISVQPDRNPVKLNESFSLVFSASKTPDGEPDFSPLSTDFEILNQGQSSNISLINGNYSRSVTWTLNLIPKRAGNILIPPVAFGTDSSAALAITVLANRPDTANTDEDLFVEVSAFPENPYLQAQVIYTVSILRRVDIAQASLNELTVADTVIEKLGDDRSFTTVRNGVRYRVVERKYAVFPQKSGPLVLPPLELTAEIYTSRRRGFFSRQATRVRRFRSRPVNLDVRPRPPAFKGSHWLPAVSLGLQQEWSEKSLTTVVGEPLTHTLTIRAEGALLNQLPDINILEHIAGGAENALQSYPDQPVSAEEKRYSGVFSIREQKTALIASRPGTYRIAPIEVKWWNTRTGREETARLPGSTIVVKPAADSAPDTVVPPSDTISQIQTGAAGEQLQAGGEGSVRLWQLLSAVLAGGWLITLWYFLRSGPGSAARKQAVDSGSVNQGRPQRLLKTGCAENNPAKTRQALMEWARLRWPSDSPTSLAGLAQRCGGELGTQIDALGVCLYARGAGDWSGGRQLWTSFKGFQEARVPERNPESEVLEPLYRS